MKNLELQRKAIDRSHYSGKKNCRLDAAKPDCWYINISFTQSCYSIAMNVSYQQQAW